jgi:hypothetical protein
MMKKDKNVFFIAVIVLAGVLFISNCDGGKGEGELPGTPWIELYYVMNREVGITWAVVDNAGSYNLYWNNTGGVTTSDNAITNLLSSFTGIVYRHNALSLFKTYYYMVTAENSTGESSPSNEVSAVPVAVPEEYQKMIASDFADMDHFGFSTSMSGENILVGAPNKDDAGSDSGAAYVFVRYEDDFYWAPLVTLTASDAQAGDEFGRSVALTSDYAVVGAPYQDSGGSDRGAAYVYGQDHGGDDTWGQVAKLTASGAQDGDEFGSSVSISGDHAIVGAQYEDSGGLSSGAAYIYWRDQGGADNWGEVVKLTALDAAAGDLFGYSVAIDGDYAVVGAYSEDGAGTDCGAVYVYWRNQGGADNWGEVVKLTASDAEDSDQFGSSVAIDGDYVIVGAMGEDSAGTDRGAAYVFYRNQGGTDNWGEVVKLTASDAEDLDAFGGSVSIDGDYVVVGAFYEDGSGGNNRGAAYIFGRNSGGQDIWGQVIKIAASDIDDGDNFGFSVDIDGDFAVIAVPYEETTGNADRGAIYIF